MSPDLVLMRRSVGRTISPDSAKRSGTHGRISSRIQDNPFSYRRIFLVPPHATQRSPPLSKDRSAAVMLLPVRKSVGAVPPGEALELRLLTERQRSDRYKITTISTMCLQICRLIYYIFLYYVSVSQAESFRYKLQISVSWAFINRRLLARGQSPVLHRAVDLPRAAIDEIDLCDFPRLVVFGSRGRSAQSQRRPRRIDLIEFNIKRLEE